MTAALTPQKPRDTRPPNKPSKPATPPKQPTNPTKPDTGLAADLEHAELLLLAVGRLSMDRLGGLDPALHHQLNTGLRTALRAVVSDRGGKDAPGVAASRPVRLRAGRPPLPGAVSDFCLPKAPGTQALMASLARRAD